MLSRWLCFYICVDFDLVALLALVVFVGCFGLFICYVRVDWLQLLLFVGLLIAVCCFVIVCLRFRLVGCDVWRIWLFVAFVFIVLFIYLVV